MGFHSSVPQVYFYQCYSLILSANLNSLSFRADCFVILSQCNSDFEKRLLSKVIKNLIKSNHLLSHPHVPW